MLTHYSSVLRTTKNSIFAICAFVMICSLFLSNYFSIEKHTPTMLLMISTYLTLFILIDILRKKPSYTRYFIKVVVVSAGIIAFNGLFETIFRYNVLSVLFVNLGIYPKDFLFITEIRFGLKRAQSLFDMHTSLGGFCYIAFYFLLFIRNKCSYKVSIPIYLLVLLGIMLFFTGVRSAVIAFCIGIIPFVDIRKFKSNHYIFAILCVFLILPFLAPYFESIISSITQTDKISGSNTDMRTNQFEISLSYMYSSFWFGNGISYTYNVAKILDKELYGAESAWFSLMIDQGFWGCIAYVIMYISAFVYVFKKRIRAFAFCILGFLVFDSMSSIPRISLVYFFYYIVAINYFRKYIKHEITFNNNSSLQSRKVY